MGPSPHLAGRLEFWCYRNFAGSQKAQNGATEVTQSNSDISQVCSKLHLCSVNKEGRQGRLRVANTDTKGTWVWYCPESVNRGRKKPVAF